MMNQPLRRVDPLGRSTPLSLAHPSWPWPATLTAGSVSPIRRGSERAIVDICGHLGHPRLKCECTTAARQRYRARLSGPLLDRIDIHVSVPPVEVAALLRKAGGQSSATVRERVTVARERQKHRTRTLFGAPFLNATIPSRDLDKIVRLDEPSRTLLEGAVTTHGLSARAFNKVLRVARTAADLEGRADVNVSNIAMAIQGRILDREPKR